MVAPSFPGATLEVTAAAGNISLLSPQVSILERRGAGARRRGKPQCLGDNVTAQVSQIVPGQRYTIAVTGATQDDFAVGAYQLDVSFAGDPSVVAIPPAPSPAPTVVSSPPATTNAGTTTRGGDDAGRSRTRAIRVTRLGADHGTWDDQLDIDQRAVARHRKRRGPLQLQGCSSRRLSDFGPGNVDSRAGELGQTHRDG